MSYNREGQRRVDQGAQRTRESFDEANRLAPSKITLVEAEIGSAPRRHETHEAQGDQSAYKSRGPDLWSKADALRFQPGETAEAFSDVVRGIGAAQRTRSEGGAMAIQRKAAGVGGSVANQRAIDDVQRATTDAGAPLPEHLRERFESSLGAELSGVRVHTRAASAKAAASVSAKAYTTGQDIHFAAGMYDPASKSGQQLIAHEVAHTVQQSGVSGSGAQFKLNVSQPGDALEHEADAAADAMVAGTKAAVSKGTASGVIARSPDDVCEEKQSDYPVCAPSESNASTAWEQQGQAQSSSSAASQVPPPPRDWSATPAEPTCPMEAITGDPEYKDEYAAENLNTYKAAFNSSWSELQTGYNAVVLLNRGYKEKEKEVIPLLQVDPSRVVGAGMTGVDASKSFDGAKLKEPLTKVGSAKSPDLRGQIFKARDKISAAKSEIENKRDGVEIATEKLGQAINQVEVAGNQIQIVESDQKISNLQLDKEQVKRDLDQQKANIKAVTESAKLITSIINCWSDPTKLFSNVIGAVNQGINAGGAIAEAAYVSDANDKLANLDGQIRELTNYKASLQVTNAQKLLDNAIKEVRVKINEAKIAVRQMQAAKRAYSDAYRDMAQLMEKVGTASGLKPQDRKALSGAVEALPKIEVIQQQLLSMDQGLKIPQYSEASGIGAAMTYNLNEFTNALRTLKGNKEYVAELKAVWEGRRAAVLAIIDQSVSVAGDDSSSGE